MPFHGFLANFGARRFPKGERNALWCARRRIPLALVEKDAPTPAREWDLPSRGALTLFFRWRKKSVQKKASGTALREKALYCPFLKEGVRNVARRLIGEIPHTFVRARAHSFPLSKRARLFPSAAYRRSAPPQLALGRLNQCRLGWFAAAWIFLQCKRPAGFHIHAGLCCEP